MNRGLRNILPFVVLLVWLIAATPSTAHAIPDATGYVSDFAGVLSYVEKYQLENLSKEVRDANGTELAIVTVETVGDSDFDRARVDYFNDQGIGKEWANNGVLVLLATKDRKIGITTGKGMEGALPDSLCKEIIDTKGVPHFKTRGSEQWGKGLIAITAELVPYIKGEKFPAKVSLKGKGWCFTFIGVWAFIVIIIALLGYAKRVRCPVCRGKVKLHKRTIVLEPGNESPGLEKREYKCTVCKYKFIRTITLPAVGRKAASGGFWGGWSSSSSGGWSSGGGGGSFGGFGGGFSGGGGASSGF